MRTIISEAQRFPVPTASVPALVIKNWIAKRIAKLESGPMTAHEARTLQKLRNIDIGMVVIEPPVIIDENRVKICILSRKVGTLWLDEPVDKISFEDFLSLAFPNAIPNSTLYRAEPYTLAELEALIDSEVSAPVPGYVDVIDENGKQVKVIIGDVLTEETVHREALFGDYKFEKNVTTVYGYDGDAYPNYPFATLNDFSLSVTTLEDVFLKEKVAVHSVPLNLLRALKIENLKPAKLVSAAVFGEATVQEQTGKSVYDITNTLNVLFDKAPKPSDLVVVSLVDDAGNTVPSENYSARVLATNDPKVMNLEINLMNYQRRFFAPDATGKKFSFTVTLKSDKVADETVVKLPVVWQNAGNTHTATLHDFASTFVSKDEFALRLSLLGRIINEQVTDLTPLSFENVGSLFIAGATAPTPKNTQYALGTVDGVNTITFNLSAADYGRLDLAFQDTRIVPQSILLADPAAQYGITVLGSVYTAETKSLAVQYSVNSPYTGLPVISAMGAATAKLNGSAAVAATATTMVNDVVTCTFPFDGDDVNLNVELIGDVYVGANKYKVSFDSQFIHHLVLPPAQTTPGMKDSSGNAITNGSTTTDPKPTLSGGDMKPGSTVTVKDGEATLGNTVVNGDGTWSYKPTTELANGDHELSVIGTDKYDAPVDQKTNITINAPVLDPVDKALADPSQDGTYSAPGEAGFGATMESTVDVSAVKATYDLTATPITMYIPYVDKGTID